MSHIEGMSKVFIVTIFINKKPTFLKNTLKIQVYFRLDGSSTNTTKALTKKQIPIIKNKPLTNH